MRHAYEYKRLNQPKSKKYIEDSIFVYVDYKILKIYYALEVFGVTRGRK
jgi:hypothetical protein